MAMRPHVSTISSSQTSKFDSLADDGFNRDSNNPKHSPKTSSIFLNRDSLMDDPLSRSFSLDRDTNFITIMNTFL